MIGLIDTKSRILIENTADRSKSGWLNLPFSEEDLNKFLSSIGVDIDDEDDPESDYDRLMAGELPAAKWEVAGHESYYLTNEHFEDIYAASDLVERIESLKDWELTVLDALIEDGDKLEEAIEIVEDGDVCFYASTDLASLDYDALGSALEDDGYTEVNGGVLRRP